MRKTILIILDIMGLLYLGLGLLKKYEEQCFYF